MPLGRMLGRPNVEAGGVLTRPRLYELVTRVAFLGRRERVLASLVARLGVAPGERVLDLGCGTGKLTGQLAAAAAPGGVATGVDVSEPMLAYARHRWPECAFVRDDAATLTAVPNSSQDVVVSCLLLHHLRPDVRRGAVGQMVRVLRPAGRILLADFAAPSSRAGGGITSAVLGAAMQHSALKQLPALLDPSDLAIAERGRACRWLRYVVITRPHNVQAPAPAGNTP